MLRASLSGLGGSVMGKINKFFLPLIVFSLILSSGVCFGDERDIFLISVNPDALILLDLSGSMNWDPAGYYCYTAGCSKLEMAKNAIKAILDDNGDGTFDSRDETSLAIRIGYMRFYSCPYDDTGGSYSSGCNSLINAIPNTDPPYSYPSRYSDVWSNVNAELASGGTPLASALGEANLYLDAHKAADSAKACRQKYVILVTDGQDTFACNGDGTETQYDMYKRRKGTVAKAKALTDAGYKVYVVGFGANMPAELMNTLNWAAYYGGTDNPSASKSGNTGAITPSTNPCGEGSSNDPGQAPLSGYAFMATSASEISGALRTAFRLITQSMISFSVASVAASRVTSENFLYEASFKPVGNDPFWAGHLKKYSINTDGSVGSGLWDAGDLLQSRDPSTRQIFTYLSGTMTSFGSGLFSSPTLAKQYLDVDTSNDAQAVVGYFRGESLFNPDNWKLGDIFHSNPITVGSPSAYFIDIRSPQAFVDFRNSHTGRDRIVVVGANDGQFRAFSGNDGSEKWSFIPPNLLPKLKYISHSTHPTTMQHMYFVDGPVTVGDVWLGSGDGKSKYAGDWHTLMVFAEGKGVRNSNGDTAFLWSSSSSCDFDFKKEYAPDHPDYCGYYAFDVTDTSLSQPALKWLLNFPASGPQTQQYLGEPWSRMAIGRVIINGNEKWVGFIGGGYSKDGDKGKGFFVVDLSSGGVIWSFTKADAPSMDNRIPVSPAIVDADNDGFIDSAYIGDSGGNIWRVTFCTGADGNACGISNWSGGKLFQSSTASPIFTTPSVGRGSGSAIWVFWGTGDKENPTAASTQDSFFAVKDPDRTSTYTLSQLVDITNSIFSDTGSGWYINLARGEKVLADPSVFGGMISWTSYIPSTGSDPCNRAGTPKLYSLAMMPVAIGGVTYNVGAGLFATSAGNEVGQRSIALGTGIAQMPIFSQKPGGTGATDAFVAPSGGGGQDFSIITSTGMADSPFKKRLQMTAPSAQLLHWRDQRIR